MLEILQRSWLNNKSKDLITKPSKRISWIIFIFSLFVVLFTLTTIIFPSLVIQSTSPFIGTKVNPFETGVWTYPFLVTNFIVFGGLFFYRKNKIPRLKEIVIYIQNFEVPKKIALVVMIVFLLIYVSFTIQELFGEEKWDDYSGVKNRVEVWNSSQISSTFEPHLRYLLLSTSLNLFGNIRILPFAVSISLVILTYFFTKELTQKRFAGLVAVVILLQSPTFYTYDTSATYDSLWVLLYLLSLYLIFKKWFLSPVSFLASLPAKSLNFMFLPMSLFLVLRSSLPKQKRKILTIIYAGIIITGIIVTSSGITTLRTKPDYDPYDFWRGFSVWAIQMRFDSLIVLFILPLVVGLFVATKRGHLHSESIMVLLIGMLLSGPFLQGFTNQTIQPYRFLPLVIYFAVGVGIIVSMKSSEKV